MLDGRPSDTIGLRVPRAGSGSAGARRPQARIPAALDRLLLAVMALGFARWNYFIQDDAYISLRYARNLARGYGLVWSPGSSEYGYTNFLFTVLESLLLAVGASGETAAALLSVPSSLAAVLLAYSMVHRFSDSRVVAFAAGATIATHTSFSAYASGGLETSMQTFLVLLTYWLAWRYTSRPTLRRSIAVGGVAALAMLVRLDSVLLLLPALLWPGWYAWRQSQDGRRPVRRELARLLPMLAVPVLATLLLLAWARVYYGQALPNTFYAKAVGQAPTGFGLYYLRSFLAAQAGFVGALALLTIASFWRTRRAGIRCEPILSFMCLSIGLWLGYLVYVGGDFMEFRMLVPVIPLYAVTAYAVIGKLPGGAGIRVAPLLFVVAICANLYHRFAYDGFLIERTTALHDHMKRPHTSWVAAGKALNQLFHTGVAGDVLIATTAAGAIPYFSDLPTVDQLGLNDRYVAKHGLPNSTRPGHRRIAPLEYLQDRRVNLVIGHPTFACPEAPRGEAYSAFPMLLIPVQAGVCSLIAYYLAPHARIDALIAEGIIGVVP